ncbi:MAG TPA: TIGR04551 family protein [Polyangia bacterium]|nr:TIGR04551 family protein [Polyangia bacterium]
MIRARGAAAGAVLTTLFLLAPIARAQYTPGGMGAPGGMQPPQPMGQEPKEEGPAEEAPEEDTKPADQEPLQGYPDQDRRKLQVFEIDGYLRLRADYMHDFFLGQGYTQVQTKDAYGNPTWGLPPFPVPLECARPTSNGAAPENIAGNAAGTACPQKNIGGANLRLRLEPTLNISDQVRVHAQFDVLDNTVLGSTPDTLAGINGYNRPDATAGTNTMASSTASPSGFLYNTQDAPEVGQNGYVSSVRAKRAWAEIDSEFGSLRFGRMPWHWGRGLAYNDGGCPDCDVGTTVDRVMALTQLYGHQVAVSWDLGPQGYTAGQLSLGRNSPDGYPYDLSQNDDVEQFTASILRRDNPVQLKERVDRGEPVLNYGLQVVYRALGAVARPTTTANQASDATGMLAGAQPLTPEQIQQAQPFNGFSFTPDIWAKFYYKALTVEFEGIGVFGKIDNPGYLAVDNHAVTLRQLGWVVASELKLYRESFFVGLETGGATGDQAEDPGQYLNYRWKFVQQPSGDHAINDFHFSPDYHVDEILFRHIMGTVTNAIYIKPQAAYWFDLGRSRAIGLNGSIIYSMAQVPVSTPGNSINYGVEADLGATYRNTGEGIYGGATWGILLPMGALDRPTSLWGTANASDASTAQVLRVFMGVRF